MKHKIKVERTAHYHSLGELNKTTKELWVVCHGYGQLAEFFLRKFNAIEASHRYIVAPEGFNKFYLKGFNGRVGASWMSKYEREDEINDHCNYLELLCKSLIKKAHKDCVIKVLGFSQGTATVSRWVLRSKLNFDSFIIWAGKIANDFNFNLYNTLHPNTRNYVVFGTEDEFYSKEIILDYKNELSNFYCQWIEYNGGHSIYTEPLIKITE